MKAIEILREFVADVEAVHDWARKEWPDLMVTYRKAKGLLDDPVAWVTSEVPQKVYIGTRVGHPTIHVVRGDKLRQLDHIEYHSPDGFEWGYAGSGPADTALSILADYFEEDAEAALKPGSKAFLLHQYFKDYFLVRVPKDAFNIREEQIREWVESR